MQTSKWNIRFPFNFPFVINADTGAFPTGWIFTESRSVLRRPKIIPFHSMFVLFLFLRVEDTCESREGRESRKHQMKRKHPLSFNVVSWGRSSVCSSCPRGTEFESRLRRLAYDVVGRSTFLTSLLPSSRYVHSRGLYVGPV